MRTETKILQKEGERSYGIQVKTVKNINPFVIPVLDCRDSDKVREKISAMNKNVNSQRGSRFLRPTYSGGGNSYQVSQKTKY